MLEIKNLHVSVNNNKILKGLNLSVNKGEIHIKLDDMKKVLAKLRE